MQFTPFGLLALLITFSLSGPIAMACDGYGYSSSGGPSRTITISPKIPPNYPDDVRITFTASVNCTDPSIQIGVSAIRQDGVAMDVLPAPSGSAPFVFTVHLKHTKTSENPETVEIRAFVASGEPATPDQLTVKVYPYKKFDVPTGSISYSGGVYQSGSYKFSQPGENTTFTASATDRDRAEVPGNFAIRNDLFENANAFEWTNNGTANGQEYEWTAPSQANAAGSLFSEIILKAKDDALYAKDWEYHQEIDRIGVNVFDLDDLTVERGGAETPLIQEFKPETARQSVIAHSMGRKLSFTDTVVPILRFEMIDNDTGGVVATDERQSAGALLDVPRPGRYKFKITNIAKNDSVTSDVYTWYGITVTPENFSLAFLPDPVTLNNQAPIDAKTRQLADLTKVATELGSAAFDFTETINEGRARYPDWDRVYFAARRRQDLTNPSFVELNQRVGSIFVVLGGVSSAYELFTLDTKIANLSQELSRGRQTLQQLGPLLRSLRANPRITPPPKTLKVKTVPGNISVTLTQTDLFRETSDARFGQDLVSCNPSSFTTDDSGIQDVQVLALGNLGKTKLEFTASQGGAPAVSTVEVTGITQEEAMAAALAYVQFVQNTARAFQAALTVLFGTIGVGIALLYFFGAATASIAVLAALAAGLVAFMVWLTSNTVSPLQRSIRDLYPRGN